MTITATTVIQDIGEVYFNLGLENDNATTRTAIVNAQISRAETDVTQAGGSIIDAVVRPLAGAYCCNAGKGGQGPNTLGNDDLQQKRDNFIEEAKWAALRNGFRIEGSGFQMQLTND